MKNKITNLVVFFVPADERVNGGIMSIFSLCSESRNILQGASTVVALSVYPGLKSYRKNSLFENEEYIYEFDELIEQNPDVESVILHIPEGDTGLFTNLFDKHIKDIGLKSHVNILNQNINYMPGQDIIASLYSRADLVTETTAHKRYATQEIADRYGIPTHHFSVYLDQSQYSLVRSIEKKPIILFSPDEHPKKSSILKKLRSNLLDFDFIEINDMSYEQYKKAVADSKYVITFGEGFDGYFIESIFSGSIPFAVHNDVFFPKNTFKSYSNVSRSYVNFADDIISFIRNDGNEKYDKLNDRLRFDLSAIYSTSIYRENIRSFYKSDYSFYPSAHAVESMLVKGIQVKDAALHDFDAALRETNATIEEDRKRIEHLEKEVEAKNIELERLHNNIFWKIARKLKITK